MIDFMRVLLLFACCAAPAAAEDKFKTPVNAHVLPGWVQADGTRMAGLHLSLAPGWKTYWRAPGDAGIPPQFDWSGSKNARSVAVTWPTPKVFDQNGMRSIGYTDDLVIPLTIVPQRGGDPVRLRVKMDLGVCADICVPHSLSFDAEIATTNRTPTPQIAAALAARPYTAREAGVTAATCRIEPTADGLRIRTRVAMPTAGGSEVVVIEPGIADVWVSESDTRREGNHVIATSDMMHVNAGPIAVQRSDIRITVLGSSHAVDIQGCTPG